MKTARKENDPQTGWKRLRGQMRPRYHFDGKLYIVLVGIRSAGKLYNHHSALMHGLPAGRVDNHTGDVLGLRPYATRTEVRAQSPIKILEAENKQGRRYFESPVLARAFAQLVSC